MGIGDLRGINVIPAWPGMEALPDALGRMSDLASPRTQARAVASLSAPQWVKMVERVSLPASAAAPLFAEAVSVAEGFLAGQVEDGDFLQALFLAWEDERFVNTGLNDRERLAAEMLNLAIGTCGTPAGLSEERADEVRLFDRGLAFLSAYRDEDEQHYSVETVGDWLRHCDHLLTQDEEDEAVFAVFSVLADPAFATTGEALCRSCNL